MMSSLSFFSALILTVLFQQPIHAEPSAKRELEEIYNHMCNTPSDINEHIPVLRQLSSECASVVEIGLRDIKSSYGIFLGLSESPFPHRFYFGIDIASPPEQSLSRARRVAEGNGLSFIFWKANDMEIDLPLADMLFIDSLHTYCHLTYELEKFSSKIRLYIAMHDTSAPWGDTDDLDYRGNYSEYPTQINRSKRGLWPAVEDFLTRHPEWTLQERRTNCHGFTVLKRVL